MDNAIKKLKKNNIFFLIITTAVTFGISSFLLSPLYIRFSSDIVYKYTAIPTLLDFIINIFDILSYALCFSTITFSIYKIGKRASFSLILAYCIAVLLKYLSNIIVQMITEGSVIIINDLIFVILNYFFEIIMLLLIILAISLSLKKQQSTLLPIKIDRLLDISNPIQRALFFVGVILSSIKILTRFLFDIVYGAPQNTIEIIWMIIYYFSDILICPIAYFVSVFVILYLEKRSNIK